MGMFDDILAEARSGQPAAPAPSRSGMFDDILAEARGQNSADTSTFAGQARDVARSVDEGGNRALAGLLGAPADLAGLAVKGADWLDAWSAGKPYEQLKAERDARSVITEKGLERFGSKAIRESMAAGGRPEYKPQTTAGEYARTGAEFGAGAAMLPLGGGSVARNVIGYGVVPGLASEAAGQATEGTAAEPWARAGAALGTGLGVAGALRPSMAERTATQSLRAVPEGEREAVLARAQSLLVEAEQRGIPLSVPNALDAASGGLTNVSDLQRHVEAMGGMRDFYARMPDRVDQAARATFDTMAPTLTAPSRIGPEISDAARTSMLATPEGQQFTRAYRAVDAARTSPDQAGQVIQRDLMATYDQRLATRGAQADIDYPAARNAPETIGIERRIEVERPGEPIVTYPNEAPRFSPDTPAPLGRAPTVAPEGGAARPESFTRWLAREGGIPMDADVRGQDLNRAYVPGFGTLARNNAPSWDQIRVRLMEEGWQPADWANSARDSDVRDFVMDQVRRETMSRGRAGPLRADDEAGTFANRRGQDADEYRNALSMAESQLDEALERAGVPPRSVQPEVRSRALNALLGDPRLDPLDAYESVVGGMREPMRPFSRTPTITEEITDVRFGQVNPQPALERLRDLQRNAKGQELRALRTAERNLYGADGQLDLTVEGLHGARRALDDAISEARRAGRGNQAGALIQARNTLDEQLKTVPEVATADANFARNSRLLEPFADGTPLGRVTQRDPDTGRPTVPAEQVPSLLSGATAAREFLANATPQARQAFERRLLTEIVDGARRPGGEIDANALRSAMQRHEDVLGLLPDVANRVQRVAATREALSRLDGTLLGQLAQRDTTTKQAVRTLFPDGPNAGSQEEVGRAVRALAQRNPTAARQLVRVYAENTFNDVPSHLERGKVRFGKVMGNNPQEAANFDAALRALPNGDTIADGFRRFTDVLDASLQRRDVGSRTAYNAEQLDAMKRGNLAERGASMLATGGIKLPAKTLQRIEEWRLKRNLDQLARLFSDPDAVSAFRGLLNGQVNPVGPMARLVAIASRDASGTQAR